MQGYSNKRALCKPKEEERCVPGVIENLQATFNSRSFLPRRRIGYTPHFSGSALCCCIMPIINHVTTRDAFDALTKTHLLCAVQPFNTNQRRGVSDMWFLVEVCLMCHRNCYDFAVRRSCLSPACPNSDWGHDPKTGANT